MIEETRPSKTKFIEKYNLWDHEQKATAAEVCNRINLEDLTSVRFSFADQHGILRGKTIVADAVTDVFEDGVNVTTSLLAKDTSHKTVFPVWEKGAGMGLSHMEGAGDIYLVPDPATFKILPWASKTGWIQCDIYFSDGSPVPFCTRRILRNQLKKLAESGKEMIVGIEVEFHVMKLDDPSLAPVQSGQPPEPPKVSLMAHGFQYLTEIRVDEVEPIISVLQSDLLALGLPLRSVEVEFGPSQIEFTFKPLEGLAAADLMIIFRSAVKQICRRHGYHATFMCRPNIQNVFASGWHLHQSLREKKTGKNLFVPKSKRQKFLSETGLNYIGGILQYAIDSSVFTTPTINGYKRYRPFTLAPDRIVWGADNKGAMVRAIGGTENLASRVENRVGEPAANPYLYIVSQLLSGLEGIKGKVDPGLPSSTPYDTDAPQLPRSLEEAISALRKSRFYRNALGNQFVDYIVAIKAAEVSRFLSDVTDWEQKEYFEIF